ncbi:hypothetical protein EOK75_18980 (plasmid) [Pseudorhodobacter turbinis]|uniref:Carrier domain-containing protein n=1 Tax=Pseudorhodobacter turbinis TaxID=2500533 RepID=A0A4P8EKL9_9RHOB|nr:AMP-binding protein [Pseudorhodobacter turbinis]QCO57770.1 hypothetical protein EOK75_18980 [Pseudorhodobacter turbinis]
MALFTQALSRAAEAPELALEALFDPVAPIIIPQPHATSTERLFDGFLRQARQTPTRVALLGEGWQMTYSEVEAASAQLARRLVASGLGEGARIGILAERGPQLVWTEIAVLRIGATMVPLDSSYPEDRLRKLTEIAQIDALVTPNVAPRPDWLTADFKVIAAVDAKAAVLTSDDVSDSLIEAGDPERAAYILFTSGSTGTPKGVATAHAPALHFLNWQRKTFNIGPEDRFTNLNGVAHDMMIRDIFQPLSTGGELAIPKQEDIYRPGRLIEWVIGMQPTAMHLTPAMGNLLTLAAKPGQVLPMRLIFSGGDQLLPSLTRKLAVLVPDAQVVNFYGATETPQAATYHVVDRDTDLKSHPIGRGIDGVSVRVVDAAHQPVAPGVSGEIAIISPYPSLGYVQNGEIIPHAQTGLYFTGDSGFELPNGEVMFTGRQDDQISIRGYRIELGEIVHALTRVHGVQDAKVLLDDRDGNQALVAFVVMRPHATQDANHLYKELSRVLPHYMVPKDIVLMEAFPLLPNGKLDRKGLLAWPRPSISQVEGRTAETATEQELCDIWGRLLGVEKVSPDHSFVELRGDSLNFVEVCLATEAIIGDLPHEWEELSISKIAAMKSGTETRSLIKWIETPLFVRAVAIVLVVTLHLKTFSLGGGSTSALFMVSGFLIARLQLQTAFTTRSVAPFWQLISKVMIPSLLYVLAIAGVEVVLGKPTALEAIFFFEDFVDMQDRTRMITEGHMIPLWYISCFFHMLLMLMGALVISRRVVGESLTPRRFVLAMVILGLGLRFITPALFLDDYPMASIHSMSAVAHMPTTHFGIFVLGMGIGLAQTTRERLLYTLLTGVYAFGSYAVLDSLTPYLIGIVGIMMIYITRLPIPRHLHRGLFMLSGASLFIYLTHQQFAKIGVALHLPHGSMALVVMAVGGGILVWMAWLKLVSMLNGSAIGKLSG